MAETIIWAVTRGEYEDTHVVACFTTAALAEEHAARIGGDVTALACYDTVPPQAPVYHRAGRITPEGRLVEDCAWVEETWAYSANAPFSPLMGAHTAQWRVYAWGTDLDAVSLAYARQVRHAQARRQRGTVQDREAAYA
jgi:hypothetical protein